MSAKAAATALVALAALAALALAACERTAEDDQRRGPARPAVERLPGLVVGQVATRQSAEAAQPIDGIDDVLMGQRFRRAVLALPMFAEEGGPGPTIDFELAFGIGLGQGEPPAATPGTGAGTGDAEYVVLMLAVRGDAPRSERFAVELQGLYRERLRPGETARAAAERLVDDGIADLVEAIAANAAPRVATDTEVVALLATTEGEALLAAIREVHRRRLEAAGPRLRELLHSDDLELLIATATALGRIRDAGAVGPLIEIISRRHRELTELVLPILGQINSPEARAYLETLAEAHDRPAIRRLAREVLDSTTGPTR
jgi:hypothetical protein